MNWSFWLLAVGLTLMIADLTIAGLLEAQVWQSGAPWIDSVRAVGSYWLVRTVSALPILAGFVLFWASLVTGPRLSDAITSGISSVAPENNAAFADVLAASHKLVPTAWLSYAHVVAFGAGVGFFALSFLVLAIVPGKELEDEIKGVAPVTMPSLTASEQRGRVIYDAKDAPTVTPSKSGLSRRMCAASAPLPRHGRPNMITRSFGGRAASGRICRANSTFIPATGNSLISTIPGSSCAIRLCLRIPGSSMAALISRHRKRWICLPISNLLARSHCPVLPTDVVVERPGRDPTWRWRASLARVLRQPFRLPSGGSATDWR